MAGVTTKSRRNDFDSRFRNGEASKAAGAFPLSYTVPPRAAESVCNSFPPAMRF